MNRFDRLLNLPWTPEPDLTRVLPKTRVSDPLTTRTRRAVQPQHDQSDGSLVSATATPYVSLTDRLANLAHAMEGKIATAISPRDVLPLLHALVLHAEHGDAILDAFDHGGVDAVEDIMTPDRPDGWTRQQINPQDPRDIETQQMRAQLAELQRQVAAGGYQQQAPQQPTAPVGPPQQVQPTWVPDESDKPEEDATARVARLERELAAARGNLYPTTTTVISGDAPTDATTNAPPTGDPAATDPPTTEGDPS